MSAEVTKIDHGLAKLWTNLAELGQLDLAIGFLGENGSAIHPGTDVSIATIALYNEFGTIDSPARNFLRSTMFERRQDIADVFAREMAQVAQGKRQPVEATSNAGRAIAHMVRERIDRAPSWATPNAPSTIDKKGHDRPLLGGDPAKRIAPGTMRNAVGWAVRRGGSVIAEGT